MIRKMAEQRLDLISRVIAERSATEPEPGFLTGLAGQALFLYAYARSTGSSRCENLGFLALERALGMINAGFSWPSYAAGLAGIRFVLRYLASRGHIGEADGNALSEIGPGLEGFARQRFSEGDYDVLHGALGMYLLPEPELPASLVNDLSGLATERGSGYLAWLSRHPQTRQEEINLGLAHGIPSVLWMLSHAPESPEREALITRGTEFLLSCRQADAPNGSVFPHRITDGPADPSGRLAWCYGDPGVGAALWQIGQNLNRPDWQADAIGILHRAASRRETAPNRLFDACVCHGTAGLALIFLKMALMSGHEEFLDAASHWARATVDHGTRDSASAGYLFLTTGDRYVPSWSLLEGITGVGLTLLALLDTDSMGWEQGLMI